MHSVLLIFSSVRTPALVFNRPLVKFLRASDLHSAAETSISGFSNRKLMFHAQFSGITGELYAAGQIRLLSAGEVFLTGSIWARADGQPRCPLLPADRNGGCVPSFLLAEARSGRGSGWLPKSGNGALQRRYVCAEARRGALWGGKASYSRRFPPGGVFACAGKGRIEKKKEGRRRPR